MEHLGDEVTEVNFVAHSLGNLVIRRYLADCYAGRNGRKPDPRIRRIVMLAPPNNGARFAEAFRDSSVVGWVWGDSVRQLAAGGEELRKELAIPRCQFGILAGGRGNAGGRNPWLDGDDDMVVSVEETKLPGARDFAVLPDYHGKIMDDDTARKHILSFLQNGYFISDAQRRPLPPEPAETPAKNCSLYETPAGAATPLARALHRLLRPGRHGRPWSRSLGVPGQITSGCGLKLALLPPGEFQMGTTDRELEQMLGIFAGAPRRRFLDEMPAHRARADQQAVLPGASCEVTRGQYRRFVEATHYAAG